MSHQPFRHTIKHRLTLAALLLASATFLPAQTDTSAPSVPTNLAGTAASSTSIVLYWTQSDDNTAVTAYDIYRNGAFLLRHTDNTYRDTSLTPATSHTYRVAARDAAGNVSALSASVRVTTDIAENPRLVRPENLSYLGAFRLPANAQNNYSYGGNSIGYNPGNNSLFVRGHDWYQLVGEISIPTPVIATDYTALPVAAVLQNQTAIAEGQLNNVGPGGSTMDGCKVGGLFVYGGRLIGTSYVYYDAGGSARRSHFTSGLNLAQIGDFRGMFTVGTANPGFVAGYMALIPTEWRTALGGPVLTGLSGVPIVSRSSYGPTISVFDPANLGTVDPIPATMLVGYDYEHSTLGTWGNSTELNPQYNMNTGVAGAVFPVGTDSVLMIGTSGIGVPGYGQGTDNLALDRTPVPGTNGEVIYIYDPAGQAKGTHSFPYVAYIWAYRADDLARVAAGTARPWELVPYATWTLSLPIGPYGHNSLCGAAYDPATNRLFVCQYNASGPVPVIHVYQVLSGATPDTQDPTIPTGLAVTDTTTSSVSLSWTASTDNIGVTGYGVFRNNSLIGTSPGTTFINTGLSASTTLTYSVSAYDAAGNVSDRSTAVNVATLSGSSSSSSSSSSGSSSSSSSSGAQNPSTPTNSGKGGGAPSTYFFAALATAAAWRIRTKA